MTKNYVFTFLPVIANTSGLKSKKGSSFYEKFNSHLNKLMIISVGCLGNNNKMHS